MIRYVAIGAVVGFLVAYFLLSHEPDGPPPPGAVAPWRGPQRAQPQDLLNLQPLPEQLEGRRPREAAPNPDR